MTIVKSKSTLIVDKKTRIIIADDHPLLRKALRNVLESQPDFEVIGEARDGEEVVSITEKLTPDVVIMDISMPKLNGLEATKQIMSLKPQTKVLALTVHNDNEYIIGIFQAGAGGYLMKTADDSDILSAMRALIRGEVVLSPEVSKEIFKYVFKYYTKMTNTSIHYRLTTRELEILRLLAKGLSNKEIAGILNLSMRTIKGYLADLFVKLNVTSRTEAVVYGLREGILNHDDFDK